MNTLVVLVLIVAAAGQDSPQANGKRSPSAVPDDKASLPTIAVKPTPAESLALREHTGPYWRIGPLIGEVQKYMTDHGRAGPIVVRYDKGPPGRVTRTLHAGIGFVVDESYTPEVPFGLVRKEAELVAWMAIEGRSGPTQHDYVRIREWALARGYESTGQVIEVYASASGDRSGGLMSTEIQVVVVPRVPPPAGAMAARDAERRAPADRQPAGTAPIAMVRPTPSQPVTEYVESEEAGLREPSGALARTSPLAETQTRKPEPVQSIRELIAIGEFNRVAEQLMPDNRAVPPLDQLWLGQFVFRIGAVARGLEQVYPGQAGKATTLAQALTSRHKKVYAELKHAPLAEVAVRLNTQDAPVAVRRREVMNDVDRLLARIALGAVGVDDALDELGGVLERVQGLLEQVSPITVGPIPEAPN